MSPGLFVVVNRKVRIGKSTSQGKCLWITQDGHLARGDALGAAVFVVTIVVRPLICGHAAPSYRLPPTLADWDCVPGSLRCLLTEESPFV